MRSQAPFLLGPNAPTSADQLGLSLPGSVLPSHPLHRRRRQLPVLEPASSWLDREFPRQRRGGALKRNSGEEMDSCTRYLHFCEILLCASCPATLWRDTRMMSILLSLITLLLLFSWLHNVLKTQLDNVEDHT